MDTKYNLYLNVSYSNGDKHELILYEIDNFVKTDTSNGCIIQIFCDEDVHGRYLEDTVFGMCTVPIEMEDVLSRLKWMFSHKVQVAETTKGERIKLIIPNKFNFTYDLIKVENISEEDNIS